MGVGFGRGGGGRVFKAIFGGVLLVAFVWWLFVGILASEETKGGEITTNLSRSKLGVDVMLVRKTRHFIAVNPDLIYPNKRKVPRGPDPIHNRHFEESERTPGRV